MTRRSLRHFFPNGRGQQLAGIIDMPAAPPLFYGVFAPCFTCTKESHGSAKICRALAEDGAAMLRFDMTGLGESEGRFADTNFSTRVLDILAACRSLEAEHQAPKLLVGHSISGTACIPAVRKLPSVQAVATIGAPRDPSYVIAKFRRNNDLVAKGDAIEVTVAGRKLAFKKSFVDDMESQDVPAETAKLDRRLFVFHAPHDAIVSFENAEAIYARAVGDRELVTLDDQATHLFENRQEDAVFIAETLMEWFRVHLK
jgi:putative redox protein